MLGMIHYLELASKESGAGVGGPRGRRRWNQIGHELIITAAGIGLSYWVYLHMFKIFYNIRLKKFEKEKYQKLFFWEKAELGEFTRKWTHQRYSHKDCDNSTAVEKQTKGKEELRSSLVCIWEFCNLMVVASQVSRKHGHSIYNVGRLGLSIGKTC